MKKVLGITVCVILVLIYMLDLVAKYDTCGVKPGKYSGGITYFWKTAAVKTPGDVQKSRSDYYVFKNRFGRVVVAETIPDEAHYRNELSNAIYEKYGPVITNVRTIRPGIPTHLDFIGTDNGSTTIYDLIARAGMPATELPPFIIKRLPVRFSYDNNYFNDKYQGIPINSYNELIDKLLDGIEVRLGTDFLENKEEYLSLASKCLYTGTIDSYFDFSLGNLDYRSLRFETETLDMQEFQPVAVVNYNERQIPYTRIIEHKHFEFGKQEKTVITREYPANWEKGDEPYYPVNDDRNNALYEQYKALAENEKNVIFGGRLGQYKYFDMDKCIESALEFCEKELSNE